jgi:lysophospholipase L1-like esterase
VQITLPHKTSLTIGVFCLIAFLLPHGPRPVLLLSTFSLTLPVSAQPKAPAPPTAVVALRQTVTSSYLAVPPASLDTFFTALSRTDSHQPGAVTRILHYGDSPTTADSITADVRRLLQTRFGDAGHGFLLIAKPWAWYGHNGIKLDAHGWHIQPASQGHAPDGIHGLGGVSFTGEPGATSWVALPDDKYSRATVYYLTRPAGGDFTISAEGTKIVDVSTAADDEKPAFAEFALPPGTRNIELGVSSGSVRLFGYRFDKDQPGVQYSSLGINGAQVQMIVRYFNAGQWAISLQHENPDLVVLNYGTNESIYPAYVEKDYPAELRRVIATLREALPHSSLLLMGPMDRGTMTGGEIVTPPSLPALIEVQKKVAAETGCAFFNTYEAMGGAGTMGRWYNAQPRLVSADFLHPMPAGAAIVGELFENALVQAWQASRQDPRQDLRQDPRQDPQ